MSCPELLTLQNLPVERLICMVLLQLSTTQVHACSKATAKGNTSPSTIHISPTAYVLASALYYDAGRRLAADREWNHMTRLQMSHELQIRGKLADWESKEEGEGGLSEWKMRMRLVRVTLEEQEEGKRMEEMRERIAEEDEMRFKKIFEAEKKVEEREESTRKRKREDVGDDDEVKQSPPSMRMRLATQVALELEVVGHGNGVDCVI